MRGTDRHGGYFQRPYYQNTGRRPFLFYTVIRAKAEERIGAQLPAFDVKELLKEIDKSKIGPMFKQY